VSGKKCEFIYLVMFCDSADRFTIFCQWISQKLCYIAPMKHITFIIYLMSLLLVIYFSTVMLSLFIVNNWINQESEWKIINASLCSNKTLLFKKDRIITLSLFVIWHIQKIQIGLKNVYTFRHWKRFKMWTVNAYVTVIRNNDARWQ